MSALVVSIISISIIFGGTTLGSALVFFFKKNFNSLINDLVIGVASGIMIAASFFGLLIPSIEQGELVYGNLTALAVIGGFLLGGLLLYFLDKIIPHLHKHSDTEEGVKTNKISKNFKFMLAVTIHNIPEGIAVGLACGLALNSNEPELIFSCLSLAIGIAIQNFPEGAAVSVPLLEEGVSKPKAFLMGVCSGIIEPIFAIITLFIASALESTLPLLLAFAAGAMIYVTVEELLPDSKRSKYPHAGLWAFMIGFSIMMLLEIML